MRENTSNLLLNLIWALAITLMVLGLFAFMSILSLPHKFTIEFTMDNNTREAVQSINYTAITDHKYNQDSGCGYTEHGYCCVMNLGEQTENRSEIICSRMNEVMK